MADLPWLIGGLAVALVLLVPLALKWDLDLKTILPFIGLIGSQTKWATFRHRLQDRGFSAQELAQVTCPIGLPGIVGKQPEVIAVAVAAQILQTLAAELP